MAAANANPPEPWRNYTKRVSMAACKLRTNDLKRLYRIINEKQMEVRNNVTSSLSQTANETLEQFQRRRDQTNNAFVTTVQIKGLNDEVVTGQGESFFDSALLPERIVSIEYDTAFSPKTQLNFTPNNRASVFLDFSRPPWLNFGDAPSAPTPNNSNWFITADTEAWSTSLSARLVTFFDERKTSVNWLHASGVYDVLLLVAGIPLSLWGAYRLGHPVVAKAHLPLAFETALYIYLFMLSLNTCRALFSYGRWVFPKIELESDRSSAGRHRLIWLTIILGITGSALWDGLKALVG